MDEAEHVMETFGNSGKTTAKVADSENIVVFMRIPKTGGTSFSEALAEHFLAENVFHVAHSDNGRRGVSGKVFGALTGELSELMSFPPRRRQQVRWVLGHFPFSDSLKCLGNLRWLTMLRDPVQRTISHIAQQNRKLRRSGRSRDEFLRLCQIPELQQSGIEEFQTQFLTGWSHAACVEAPEAAFELAIENIEESFSVVGVLECFSETLRVSEQVLGISPLRQHWLNVADPELVPDSLDPETREWIEARTRIDRRVYEYACQRLRRQFDDLCGGQDRKETDPGNTAGTEVLRLTPSGFSPPGKMPGKKKPTVLYDASVLGTGPMDGIRRYTLELLRHLPRFVRQDGEFSVRVSFDSIASVPLESAIELVESRCIGRGESESESGTGSIRGEVLRFTRRLSRSVRKRLRLHSACHDLLHLPLPNTFWHYRTQSAPVLMTVHDLCHLVCPSLQTDRNRRTLRWGINEATRRDTTLVAVSDSTATELRELMRFPADRVHTIHEACSREIFRPVDDAAERTRVRNRYRLPDAPFLLSLCTLEPRKNLSGVVRAFRHLQERNPESDVHLVLAGRPGWGEVKEHLKEAACDRLHLIGYVDEADLPVVYSEAMAFVCLSFYEGFCLPLLEAMACGCPVIHSDRSAMPEVAGNAGLSVAPDDTESAADCMHRILAHPSLRQTMHQQSLRRAADFSWESATRKVVGLYGQLLHAREASDRKRKAG